MTENERQPVRAFTVDETAAGERLDKFLSTVCPDLTRSAAARVIEEGGVLLDGAPGNKKDKLRPGGGVRQRDRRQRHGVPTHRSQSQGSQKNGGDPTEQQAGHHPL